MYVERKRYSLVSIRPYAFYTLTTEPITHLSLNIGSGEDELLLVGIRVIPAGRDGSTVLARTLNHGEPDSGEGIVLQPGERLLFPPGSIKATVQDIDRVNTPDSYGYAVIANTVWTWLQIGPSPDPKFFEYLFAAARRLDSAHALCVSVMSEFGNNANWLSIKSRERVFRALGNAELMCIALNRADMMIKDIVAMWPVATTLPDEVDTILPALSAIRNAFEHIDERAMGRARHEHETDAVSIFNQIEFVTSGILRYANYSPDLRSQVIPALIASRTFIFGVATERGGSAKTVNVPIDFGTYIP